MVTVTCVNQLKESSKIQVIHIFIIPVNFVLTLIGKKNPPKGGLSYISSYFLQFQQLASLLEYALNANSHEKEQS